MARRVFLTLGIVGASLLVACGGSHTTGTAGTGETDTDDGGGGGSTTVTNDGIYGFWFFETSDKQNATALQFNDDGTYVSIVLELQTSSSGQSQDEAGNFSLAGGTITWTPTASTCPSPQAVYQTSYVLNGKELTVTFGSTDISFVPESSSSSGMSTMTGGSSITTGCYSNDGTSFTPAPLDPVTNR